MGSAVYILLLGACMLNVVLVSASVWRCPPLSKGMGFASDCKTSDGRHFSQTMLKHKHYHPGTECQFHCLTGDVVRRVCLPDFTWDGPDPCEVPGKIDDPLALYRLRRKRDIGDLVGQASSFINKTQDGISEFNNALQNAQSEAEKIGNVVGKVSPGLGNAISQGAGNVINKVQEGVNKVSETVNQVGTAVNNINNAVNGNGATGNAAIDTVNSVVQAVPAIRQSKFGSAISSAASGAAAGFSIGGPWGAVIGGALGLLGSLFGGSNKQEVKIIKEELDKVPPVVECPPENIEVLADPGKTTAVVDQTNAPNWIEPVIAQDNQIKEGIKATLIGMQQGSAFPAGTTQQAYFVSDPAGNTDQCTFSVTVIVPRCGPLGPTNYGTWWCPKGDIGGARCKITCLPGFEVRGPQEQTCDGNGDDTGSWSGGGTECVARRCESLTEPPHVKLQCTGNYTYNSACAYGCEAGYGATTGALTIRICTVDAQGQMFWTGSEGTCKDIEPPKLQCPIGVITKYPGKGTTKAYVTWPAINVTDNSNEVISPVLMTVNFPPNKKYDEGYYDIRYSAIDSQGNRASCVFSIRVAVIYCRRLTNLPLGRIDCTGLNYGSTCSFGCGLGYALAGSNVTECQMNPDADEVDIQRGLWSHGMPSCTPLTCPAIPPPQHGGTVDDCTTKQFGEFCSVTCDQGYDLMGTSSRRCLAKVDTSGHSQSYWDGEESTCDVRTCKTLYPPTHGRNATFCPKRPPYQTKCSFACDKGFRMLGEPINTCLPTGRWQYSEPTCRAKLCDSSLLPAPLNGYKSGCPHTKETVGTVCTLHCNHGYQPPQPIRVTCLDKGQNYGVWSNSSYDCKPIECPAPKIAGNGKVKRCLYRGYQTDVSSPQRYGTSCTFQCASGFTGIGVMSQMCQATGNWNADQAVCKDVTPPRLECPTDRVLFAGAGRREVVLSWEWEPLWASDGDVRIPAVLIEINSQPVSGVKPQLLAEGEHVLTYQVTDKAGLRASCSFKLQIKVTRCPPLAPPTPPFGELENLVGQSSCSHATYGTICRQSCKPGYDFIGQTPLRNCRRSSDKTTIGYWSGVAGSCKPRTCKVPAIHNGFVSGCPSNETLVNSVCSFSCNQGYRGSKGQKEVKRMCQSDRTWSGDYLSCQEVTCQAQFSLQHGTVSPALCLQGGSVRYGTTCAFTCDDGYLQHGSFASQCLDSGSWNTGRKTTCTDNAPPQFTSVCPQYVDVTTQRGQITATVNWVEPKATDNSNNVTVKRQNGHKGPGDLFTEGSTRVTYIATDGTGNSAQCDVYIRIKVRKCRPLPPPLHGEYDQCQGFTPVGGACSFKCNRGYQQSGSRVRTCQYTVGTASTSWSGTDTRCEIVTCPALSAPRNAIKSGCVNDPPLTEKFGTVCSFYCRYGYAEVGNPVAKCKEDGTWDRGNFQCEVQSCPALSESSEYRISPASCLSQPQFLQSCIYQCRKSGYRLRPVGRDFVTCLASGKWTRDIHNLTCEDIERPRFTYCPSDIFVYAEKGAESAVVTWKMPVAVDNSGETPTLTSNYQPSRFVAGSHRVTYTAVDKTGNSQICDFTVNVEVRRCPRLQPPIFGLFNGSCSNVYGTKCTVKCMEGYQLQGSSTMTCDLSGKLMYWDMEQQPRCQITGCPALTPPTNGFVYPAFCTGKYTPYHGTVCSYFCKRGFVMDAPRGDVTCEVNGRWKGDVSAVNCKDVTPPRIKSCPGHVTAMLNATTMTAEVDWDVPEVEDNSGHSPKMTVSPTGLSPPYGFKTTTEVVYTFTDGANNSAQCRFTVTVQEDIAPLVISCPSGVRVQAQGHQASVSWKMPEFALPDGSIPVITPAVSSGEYTWGNHTIQYSARNSKNGKTSFCTFMVSVEPKRCPPLDPPENGALSCNNWGLGRFCSMLCNEKWDIPRGITAATMFACGSTGIWKPTDVVPDCVEPRDAISRLPSELHYFTGDCNNASTQAEIKNNFIQILLGSVLSNKCNPDEDCKPENVQVTCGPVSMFRRKRQSDSTGMRYVAKLNFDLQMLVKTAGYKTTQREAYMAQYKLYQMAVQLRKMVGDGDPSLTLRANIPNRVDTQSFKQGRPQIACDSPDLALSGQSLKCVSCPRGTRFNPDSTLTSKCDPCPLGTYQNESGQWHCVQCPVGHSTRETGSKNVTQCLALCKPGSFSATGLKSCTLCKKGEYQDKHGAKLCNKCIDGTTTVDVNSSSSAQCKTTCPPGSYSRNGVVPCSLCPVNTYQPEGGSNICIPCPRRAITQTNGSVDVSNCKDVNTCLSSPCQNGGTCVNLMIGYTCRCPPGYTGDTCDTNIDDCLSQPCTNNGICVDGVDSFTCRCLPGFEGDDCYINTDECQGFPCKNNATCIDGLNQFTCRCQEGFQGKLCETITDNCKSSPCKHGGRCQSVPGDHFCLCPQGYVGKNCEITQNNCRSALCLNGATCTSTAASYSCTCPRGYTGRHCEHDLDLCQSSPCVNGGTCIDVGTDFTCSCPPGFSGKTCQSDLNPCDPNPCRNGGSCSGELKTDNYTCACVPGFTGMRCEVDIDDCADNPCSGGGTCQDLVNGFTCVCPPGLSGKLCEQQWDVCYSAPCLHGATCEDRISGYFCRCPPQFTGKHCETLVSSCVDNPCSNGGICIPDNQGNFSCICNAKFTGKLCDVPYSPCSTEPCYNDARCVADDTKYTCICKAGFTGDNCQVDIDECTSNPCLNNATCEDGINSFTCTCPPGFTGALCDQNIDDCLSQPCAGGATCHDLVNGYRCECLPGNTGPTCNERRSLCSSSPCVHAERCEDKMADFLCVCQPGWTGQRCEVDIDECASNPCHFNGTCVDLVNGYNCTCPEGFTGTRCEVNIDDCNLDSCHNGAQCIDGINRFTCICPSGWTGTQCEVNIDDCASQPCDNGATCVDGNATYTCVCLPGFNGKNCQVNIDDCTASKCRNGGSCVDLVNDFDCICAAGYTGKICDQDLDECLEFKPCKNGATCVDGFNSYQCQCADGFTGDNCEVDIDDCVPNPCSNGGTCKDLVNSFQCTCPPGYSGSTCEQDVDECYGVSCGDGGTCIDGLNSFSCVCAPGYTGKLCAQKLSNKFDLRFLKDTPDGISYAVVRDVAVHKLSAISMLTLQVWIRSSKPRGVIAAYRAADGSGFGLKNPGDIEININSQWIQTGVVISDGQWHQVTLTLDSRTHSMALHLDGQQAVSLSNITFTAISTGGNLIIGQRHESMKMRRKRAIQTDVAFVGDISQLHLWDFILPASDVAVVTDCQQEETRLGNMVAWSDVVSGVEGQVEVITPTQCDPINECSSGPCQHGATCQDKIGGFQCHCLPGYTGDKCQVNVDDCVNNSCSNGATCVDGIQKYTCVCAAGFTGMFCQEQIVDGAWGSWSLWSQCTKSCDSGTRTRNRHCDNPPPSSGGRNCVGSRIQREHCNTDECPACLTLSPPVNGVLNCTTSGALHECVASCRPRHNFNGPVLEKYFCGANTSFRWNHETSGNPAALLPSCGKITTPINVSLDLFLFYPFRNCSDRYQPFLETKFQQLILNLSSNVSCINTGECSLTAASVGRCGLDSNSSRTGYVAAFVFTAHIALGETEMTNAFQRLSPVAKMVQANVLSGGFRLWFSAGNFLMYDPNSLVISGSFGCKPGSVSSNNTCVLCPQGTFYDDGVCARCAVGSFQTSDGQFDCDPCPAGKTTSFSGATSLQDCI